MNEENGWRERRKAQQRPVDGPYVLLALEVRRLLGWFDHDIPFLTSRMAARKTGVNYTTINQMLRGDRPKQQTLERFAEKMTSNANRLLQLAGYQPVKEDALLISGSLNPARYLFVLKAIPDYAEIELKNYDDFQKLTIEQKAYAVNLVTYIWRKLFVPPIRIYRLWPEFKNNADFMRAVFRDWWKANHQFAAALARDDASVSSIDNLYITAVGYMIEHGARRAILTGEDLDRNLLPEEAEDDIHNSLADIAEEYINFANYVLFKWFFQRASGEKLSLEYQPIFKEPIRSFLDFVRFYIDEEFRPGTEYANLFFQQQLGLDSRGIIEAMDQVKIGNIQPLDSILNEWKSFENLYVTRYNEGDGEVFALDEEVASLFRGLCKYYVELKEYQEKNVSINLVARESALTSDETDSEKPTKAKSSEESFYNMSSDLHAKALIIDKKLKDWYIRNTVDTGASVRTRIREIGIDPGEHSEIFGHLDDQLDSDEYIAARKSILEATLQLAKKRFGFMRDDD